MLVAAHWDCEAIRIGRHETRLRDEPIEKSFDMRRVPDRFQSDRFHGDSSNCTE